MREGRITETEEGRRSEFKLDRSQRVGEQSRDDEWEVVVR